MTPSVGGSPAPAGEHDGRGEDAAGGQPRDRPHRVLHVRRVGHPRGQ